MSCLINPSDYTRGGWLTRRPIPKAEYMTLGPKFFCCSKMAVTRRRKHVFQKFEGLACTPDMPWCFLQTSTCTRRHAELDMHNTTCTSRHADTTCMHIATCRNRYAHSDMHIATCRTRHAECDMQNPTCTHHHAELDMHIATCRNRHAHSVMHIAT